MIGDDSLSKAVARITNHSHFVHTQWGALFVDQNSGVVVFKHDSEKLFIPASTTKLFTVACALDALGADHRFLTPVVMRGEMKPQGILEGDLILIASGDLRFGGRATDKGTIAFTNVDHTYALDNSDAELTMTNPLAGLNELARQVAALGIKHVSGDLFN